MSMRRRASSAPSAKAVRLLKSSSLLRQDREQKPAAINHPRPRSALLKATQQQRQTQRVPEKWLSHYHALVGLRHRLVRED